MYFCFLELYDKHNKSDEDEGEVFPAPVEELDPETKPEVKPEESAAEISKISEGVEKIEISHEQKEEKEEARSKE